MRALRQWVWVAAAILAGCSPQAARHPADTLVRLSDDEAKGLDPQKVSDLTSLRIAADQFEGLTRLKADGTAELGLAQSRACDAAGLSCRFTLKPNLRFSDGVAITAQTFAGVFQRLHDPATAAPNLKLFDGIETVSAQGPDVVAIRLSRPLPWLDAVLTQPAMAALPLHRIAKAGERWTAERPMVTSGAYRLTDWRLGDRITLARNPAWHDGAAPFPQVQWAPAEDKLAALRLFRAGGADTVSDVPTSRIAWVRANLPGALHIAPYAGTYYLVFNTRQPPFDDMRLRQALSLAVDRDWIATHLLGTGETPARGLVPPVVGGRDPEALGKPDPARIRALLAAVGYGPKHPLVFDVRFNSGGDHRRIAVALAAMWAPYGVTAHLLNSEAALHFAALRAHDFTLARSGWIADLPTPENFLSVHLSDAGAVNYSGHADPFYDALFAQALATPNPARRGVLLQEAETRLLRDAAILPIYHYVSRSLVAPRITGWQDNAMNVHPSRTLRLK